MSEIILSERLPVLALRGLCVFPKMLVHFDVGRKRSVRAVDEAMKHGQEIFLVTQRDLSQDDPDPGDLYEIGVVAQVRQVLKLPNDMARILVEGKVRARVVEWQQERPYLRGRVESLPDRAYRRDGARAEALLRQSEEILSEYAELTAKNLQKDMMEIMTHREAGFVADYMAQYAEYSYEEKQRVLSQRNPLKRLEMSNALMRREVEVCRIEAEIKDDVQKRIGQGQREAYLREQIKVLHQQLGDGDEDQELQRYAEAMEKADLPEEAAEKLHRELDRLAKQPAGSAEAAVIRTYLDTCLELPWNVRTREQVDVAAARRILERDHFGLEKVKERILEVLAVRQLAPDLPPQILCLVGPPGTGKTSVAYSIARCLRRNIARISLGGVHDEADIRGHRKTYIGAMPGRIIQGVRQAGSKNALLLLDEIDKMGSDYRGDPSAALLEVLDPDQNRTFRDHYLETAFDLSECMFITTANTLDTVPRPLLDRMEVIELGSYTDEEKLQIAKGHLLPKQMKKHGLKRTQLRVTDGAIREIINCYTREAGVRSLERQLAALCRKADMRLLEKDAPKRVTVDSGSLDTFLGPRRYLSDRREDGDQVGVVTGLAWTAVGGETLEVEVNVVEGSGKLLLTGNLGDVMKESAQAAMSYIRSRASALGIAPDFYQTKDIHVHFPEGAVPKDGPSAGITVCTAMVSALTGAPVRRDLAMTGEISIRGRVLPIGGLREKTMAALRHGIHTVIIPEKNEKDLEEIDQTVRRALNFVTVRHVDAVIDAALDFSERGDDRPGKTGLDAMELQLPADQRPDRRGLRQ